MAKNKARKTRSERKGVYLRGTTWWLNHRVKGKRVRESLETSSEAEALAKANAIRASPEKNAPNSFEEEIDAFLAYKRRKNQFTAASAGSRVYVLKAFAAACGRPNPASVTPRDVREYYEDTLDAKTASTANTYLMILKSFFQWTVKVAKIRRDNPAEGIDRAEERGAKRKDFCTFEERDYLIANAPTDDLRFVLYCGFHAGLRKNEIIEAVPMWFDLEAGLLHLRKTAHIEFKDREERTIPLTKEFMAFLKSYGLREPYMLAPDVKHGKNRYRFDFVKAFRSYMKTQKDAEKIKAKVTPHIMRHTFASLLASRGVSLFKIAKWLGDDPRVVETRYAKLIPNDPDIEKAFGHSSKSVESPAESRSTQASS